jgi:hypothetical protein
MMTRPVCAGTWWESAARYQALVKAAKVEALRKTVKRFRSMTSVGSSISPAPPCLEFRGAAEGIRPMPSDEVLKAVPVLAI